MEYFIGTIMCWPANFAPRNWAWCDGQLLSIAQNQALFSVIGNTYGGDGRNTFALPDLSGRVPVGTGTGPGLPPISLGAMFGQSSKILSVDELPTHNHAVFCSSQTGDQHSPVGGYPADEGHEGFMLYSAASDSSMGPTGNTGLNASFPLYQPSLGMGFIICTDGIFPPRQ